MEPKELLRTLMSRDGDNPHSLASKLNQKATQPQIYRFLEGITKEPRRSTLQPVADFYKISVEAFYDSKLAASIFDNLKSAQGDQVTHPANPMEQLSDTHKVSTAHNHAKENGPNLTIRQFDTGGSMGTGVVLQDQPGVIQSMEVSQEWVQKNIRNFSSVSNLAIVTGFGDSMKPLYNSGDPLLVDRAVTQVKFEAIYFFRVGDEGFVKRLQRIPGKGILVISDNTAYRDWTITEDMDFEVFARVVKVWCGEDF